MSEGYLPAADPISPLAVDFALDIDPMNRPSLHHSKSYSATSKQLSSTPSSSSWKTSATAPIVASSHLIDDSIGQWDTSALYSWLDSIKCSGYFTAFESNHITGEVLLDCDDSSLRDIGVKKVGDRIRIGRAIDKLRMSEMSRHKSSLTKQLQELNLQVNSPFKGSSGKNRRNGLIKTDKPSTQTVIAGDDNYVKELQSMEVVKQNTVKLIYAQGQTRTANVQACRSANEIKMVALKKAALPMEYLDECAVFALESTEGSGHVRKLSDKELLAVCHSSDRLERKRLMICPRGGMPTVEQKQKARLLERDSLSSETASTMIESDAASLLRRPNRRSRIPSFAQLTDDGPGETLGMQRPPSEMISSNLSEYFPNTAPQVLQETLRSSKRFSKQVSRLSRISTRYSTASSLGLADYEDEVPPVPPLPAAEEPGVGPETLTPVASARLTDISRNSNIISAIARRMSRTETKRATQVIETEPAPEEDEEADDENINELLEMIKKEESGPTKWIKGSHIGSGSFGQVYLGMNSVTGELMAIKQVELPTIAQKGDESRTRSMMDALHREMNLLRVLHHPHVVQYFGSSSDEEHLNIFLEYVPGGSVSTMLANYGTFEESLISSFVGQILDGLDYLHKQNIIHRDIKGANVLVDNRGTVKISDFGISKKIEAEFLTSNRVSLQGSVFWMAPEVVKQTCYTAKADIWSVGCLVIEMLTGSHPFPEFSQMQAIFRLGNSGSPAIPEDASPVVEEFLKETFQTDFNKRPTAGELLLHRFIRSF